MQFAGFRSVIGTMWAVDDGEVNESGRLDHTRAAFALNKTTYEVCGYTVRSAYLSRCLVLLDYIVPRCPRLCFSVAAIGYICYRYFRHPL
ncbi:hypothetical protein V8E55_008692, partial [Tylopilus felleus]